MRGWYAAIGSQPDRTDLRRCLYRRHREGIITVSNPGSRLVITSLTVTGTDMGHDMIKPISIPPQGSAPFTMTFSPSVEGTVNGQVIIADNTSLNSTVTLQGTALLRHWLTGNLLAQYNCGQWRD